MVTGLLLLYTMGLTAGILVAAALVWSRFNRQSSELDSLRRDLRTLEARLAGLARRPAAAAPPASAGTPPPVGAPPPPEEPLAAPSEPAASRPEAVPLTAGDAPAPREVAAPPVEAAPVAGERVPPSTPAAAPPAAPPRPSGPPPSPTDPPFDWESLLGVRGAAWVGGVALVIAGLLFAKLAIDRGLVTPELRVAILVLAGVGALVGAELSLRRGYATTANAVSGAGVAVLYGAFYAAHGLYGLLPLTLTFGLMAVVTVLACVLAVRYDAMSIAVLGLLGGFATPLVLSTGEDRPIGLFSYVLMLDLGLLAIAIRKRWYRIATLALLATLVMQLGWFSRFMAPEKMALALAVLLVFGVVYLFLPAFAREEDRGSLEGSATIGGLAPAAFGAMLALTPRYSAEWPLLFGFLALLDAALVYVAVKRERPVLLRGAAWATAITLVFWSGDARPEVLLAAAFAASGLVLLLNAPRRWPGTLPPAVALAAHDAGLVAGAGLGAVASVLAARDLGEPPWPFLLLLAVVATVVLERAEDEARRPGVASLGALGLAVVAQVWFLGSTGPENLARNLAVPALLAVAFSAAAARRAVAGRPAAGHVPAGWGRPGGGSDHERAATITAVVGMGGLFVGLADRHREVVPLFAALGLHAGLLVAAALRRDGTRFAMGALVASALFALSWHEAAFSTTGPERPALLYGLFYAAFAALPFAVPPEAAPRWARRTNPWLSAALSGVLFFPVLHRTYRHAFGDAHVGVLPLLLGAVAVLGLHLVGRRFPAGEPDSEDSERRLTMRAIFAATALWFVALAVPLQLRNQWITVAWAVEAAAVWWLLRVLPHPGLKTFGAVLYALVAVRLLPNMSEVLRYEERGWPIVNWLLYTYGVPAAACFAGARFLREADAAPMTAREKARLGAGTSRLAPAASLLGLVLVFALLNLEIADYFSTSRYVEVSWDRRYAKDLTTSLAWGAYAMALLALGVWRAQAALRKVALGVLVLTVGKVFLVDLASLEGGYRVLSFLGLGIALVAVSFLYQRFVLRREAAS